MANVLYFLRVASDQALSPETMDTAVAWACYRGPGLLESLLRTLQQALVPTLLFNRWPTSIEKDVQTALHRFMAIMVEDVNHLRGRTVLYVPDDLTGADRALASNDREVVQRYEATVIHWTRQIKAVIGEQGANAGFEERGPLDEIHYWRSRARDLDNIRVQLNRSDVGAIVSILREAKSFYYLEPFLDLQADIERGTVEAFDNLCFLSTLIDPCERLAVAKLKEIPGLIGDILVKAQFILMHSKHYRKERFCHLLRMVSDEIIRRCSVRIDIAAILRGDVAQSMVALQESISAGEAWMRECRKMLLATKLRFKHEKGEKLEIDEGSLLNEIDGFVSHRCQNLKEICQGQMQFGFRSISSPAAASSRPSRHRLSQRAKATPRGSFFPPTDPHAGRAALQLPDLNGTQAELEGMFEGRLPLFSGNKGPEIESQLMDIQRAFKSKIDMLRGLDYNILDVKSTKWIDDFGVLKTDMDSLSMVMRQIITAAFDSIATTTTGAEYIEAFYVLSRNEELLLQLDRSKDLVFRLFMTSVKMVQAEIQRYFNRKPTLFYLHPPSAGHAYWAVNNIAAISQGYEELYRCYYLPESPESQEAMELYDRLVRSLKETVRKYYLDWRDSLPSKPAEYLDSYLLVRRQDGGKTTEDPPRFEVNFPKPLLLLFDEVRYWQRLGETIPAHVQDICSKEERLRVCRENIALVTRTYNHVITSLETREELRLFMLRLRFLESKYQPGLTKLWWNSPGIVEYYVRECRSQTEGVQNIVDDYKHTLIFVDHFCRAIADTLSVSFELKKTSVLSAFVERQTLYRRSVRAKLKGVFGRIVDRLYHLFHYFREDYTHDEVVRAEWHHLMESVELKLEEALKTMVKRSLLTVERTLPSEVSEDRLCDKVFRLDVVISVAEDVNKPIILAMPSVEDVSKQVNEVCKQIIATVQDLPHIEDSLAARIAGENAEELAEQNFAPVAYQGRPTEDLHLRGTYFECMAGDEDIILSLQRIQTSFIAISDKVKDKLLHIWRLHQSLSTDNLWATEKQDKRIKQGWKPEDYRINMDNVMHRRDGMDKQEPFAEVHFLLLDFNKMKETFRTQCQLVIKHYHGLLYSDAKHELDLLYRGFRTTIEGLTREPRTLDQLGEQVRQCAEAIDNLPAISARFEPLQDRFSLITSELYNFGGVDPDDVARCAALPDVFADYIDKFNAVRRQLDVYKEQFKHDLETDLRGLISNSFLLHRQVAEEAPIAWGLATPAAFAELEGMEGRARGLRRTEQDLQHGIEIFNLARPGLEDLASAESQLALLRQLWGLVEKWKLRRHRWMHMYFMTLNSDLMLEGLEKIRREVLGLRKDLEHFDVWLRLKDDIDLLKKILPIIDDMRTPAMRQRHWELIKLQMDIDFDINDEGFCLQCLMDARVETQAEFIANLSVAAREELKIETNLDKIHQYWDAASFTIEPHQGYNRITHLDDLNTALAEHLTLLTASKMSRFVENFRGRVIQWEQTLSIVTDTMEGLMNVQTKWMYLENIFIGSEDIKRKLVAEAKKFDSIHAQWLTIMSRLVKDPNVVRGTRRDTLLDQLNTMSAELEVIQKSLEWFLEDRRRVFPRFYFLSNDDLLEILGHVKEPSKVQPHLRKCFEGLYQLSLKQVRGRTIVEGMASADGEFVPFGMPMPLDGLPVEVWLRNVEAKMRETVQSSVNRTLHDLQRGVYDPRHPINREKLKAWVERNEGQSLITAASINWTQQVELAIGEYGELHTSAGLSLARRKLSPLYRVYKKWKGMIRKYCQMVRQPQSRLQRTKLVALVTIEVHARDVLRHLLARRVHQLDDFEWSRQLRFYAEDPPALLSPGAGNGHLSFTNGATGGAGASSPANGAGNAAGAEGISPGIARSAPRVCVVRQTSAVVRYDYEYLGNSGRLVITGLTDRAYMMLTTALQLFRGGLPQGPAGTGKTETVKDLGKAIGKYVMVFNCSESLDYRSVGRMLSGIAQTGAWSCFDEFNRIEVEVLSVVAQQILSILAAVSERRQAFLFEGTEIPLNLNCGIFVTMNPGYAGRSELPDNLKALLRPISMMVPDFGLICEITMLSEGFEESEGLSKKVSILYELMENQLSKQDHYDFSLRNIKAVLVQAGNLKRENFPGTESQLCLKAMKDMNLPKFVKADVPLFLAMLGDLFPGVEPQGSGLEELWAAALDELEAANLEKNAQILSKTLHLWDTLRTRHGVMVVGLSGSGKTVTWRTLAGALKRLADSGLGGPYEPVRVSLLNPKSVTMDELYGSYNQATREWKDGILSDLMRQICRDASETHYKWLLFDGPVDTLWIESMNTVLDDNKMLTLNSGERINLNPSVSMLFEVQDLSQASPATVSRCGMVYFTVEDLGWQPFAMTWLRSRRNFEIALNTPKPDATIHELEDFVLNTLASTLAFKAAECADLMPTTTLNTVRSFTTMFDALATSEARPVIPGGAAYQTSQAGDNYLPQLRMLAMFCLVWAVGGPLTAPSRQKLDSFIREMDSSFPSTETVFEYFPELQGLRWCAWEEHPGLRARFAPPAATPYHAQIVPTLDTVRYEYLISQLVRSRVHLVLVGMAGTGKSLLARKVLAGLSRETHMTAALNLSARTSARNVQDIIEGRMEHKSKKVCAPPHGRRMICLIEDLNMPAKEKFGAQPPLELLRQWLDNGFWYDSQTRAQRKVNDMQLLCCMTYGRPDISERFMSKLNIFNITFPTETVIEKIYTAILENRLAPFGDLRGYISAIVKATIATYARVSAELLPIPSKSHYLFSLRDLSKVFQGIYGCDLSSLTCKEHLAGLWLHECERVFADRMNNDADRAWFHQILNEKLNNDFQTKWVSILKSFIKEAGGGRTALGGGGKSYAAHPPPPPPPVTENESPIFVDFWDGEYDEMAKYRFVPSMEALRQRVEESMEQFNAEPGTRPVNLVFFNDALCHLCRIHRIIRLPHGNALLVGLGGSGRSSLTRLAAYLAGYTFFTIEVHKKYDIECFHENLRTLYKACGVKHQNKVFYFSDNQVMHAAFLEDINNMLSSGEVPNLFVKDELRQIQEDVRKLALLEGCRDAPDELYNFFLEKARRHLHLVVAMSPAKKEFRDWLRQFPALVSCTCIDWFAAWPTEALKEIGLRYLKETAESDETEEELNTICDMFVYMHDTTGERSQQMREHLHRYNYVTPSSYLDLVRGFRAMLTRKCEDITEQRDKLANGMSKLEETKLTVSRMTESLKVQDEKLQLKSEEVSKATESIQVRQRIAEEQQTLVASEKVKIEQAKRAALGDQTEAQADLDRAMPTLLEAQAALDKLDKSDINEVKSYKTPAAMVHTVMEAVQTALHRKLDWDEAKKSLSEPKFIDMLKTYHETHDMTDQKLLNSLDKFVKRHDFTPAAASSVSKAAGGLCQWVIAIHKYGNIYKEVHPKIVKNENAHQRVRAQEEMLRQKEEKLQRIVDEVRRLEADLQTNINEKNQLMRDARETQDKLSRARIIVDGLEGERDRWTESIARYEIDLGNIRGDTLLATGFMSYCGAFTADYRLLLWQSWLKEMRRLQLCMNRDFNFVNFLVDPTEVRDWHQTGLPGDDFSRENGAIAMCGPRYPLMIDPQQQAIKWIKRMERDNGLKMIDPKQPDFQKTVENAVLLGCPLLLQDVLEEIDPILDPIMSRAIIRKGNRQLVKLGDNYIEYNENFKLYITTRLSNPHYSPETCTKVCLLNFAVKEQGLEEQLLKIVVEREKPELEHENEKLILDMAAAKKETKRLEDDILDLLSSFQCSLLENKRLIDTLQSAKVTAANIKKQLKESEETSVKISQAREEYRECAQRASILFFVLADLGAIDSMYQFALDSYIELFQNSIRRSTEKITSRSMEERIKTLNTWHTAAVYTNTCRGLFEQHKLLFAFHMTMRILQAAGKVNLEEYTFLMRGGQILDKQGRLPNPAPLWLSERCWDHLLELDKLTNFHGIAAHVEQNADLWREWYLLELPEEAELPGDWQNLCRDNYIQKMIFVRCLRPDRLVFMVYEFIEDQLGSQFVEPPSFNLKEAYEESSNSIPLVFVLSAGVDPTTQLNAIAQREGHTLKTLALGQGQGENAKRAIQELSQTGGWVFLANCHLMVSWLVELEKIIDDLAEQNPHKDFRLWLSSVPTPGFPIGILQRAIKMTTEPPKGIKGNMLRLYNGISEEQFADHGGAHPVFYRNLLFALCFFHSVLLERRKYGTLGYNVLYDFTAADFEVSENILERYLHHTLSDLPEDIPFVTIRYLIAEASYGGRVTDDWDRRLLNTYIAQYMCVRGVREERYALSAAAEYVIPAECTTVQACLQECARLPITDPAEAFGQHANADIASRIAESSALLENLIGINATLARGGGGGGGGGGGSGSTGMGSSGGPGSARPPSQEDRCLDILASLEEPSKAAIPALIDYDAIFEATSEERQSALNTCLLQEVQRFNLLLAKIHRQRGELRLAVRGRIVMSDELEGIFTALLLGRVPVAWGSAYPSLKPLASWSVDLVGRVEQLKMWGQRTPAVFWLSGLTYPTGFLKSLQQQQARTDRVSIDQYGWEFLLLTQEERSIIHGPKKGAYVRGIYLEGAGWNFENNTLCEPNPMELIVRMPVIHFIPKLHTNKPPTESIYKAPLYMYPIRTGTRERPSFVVAIDLESGDAVPEHYTKRGTALLLSTDE
ncbi:unnamed protein product [Phytomonas sp. Hart1]|nr:unnamed protein product [Phytomonas sp. Hart1]|eukprot:CCW67502.1 unnamed protein product [Phytomonas sp. isolate Hart1]